MIEIKGTKSELCRMMAEIGSGSYPAWILAGLTPGEHAFRRSEIDIRITVTEEEAE